MVFKKRRNTRCTIYRREPEPVAIMNVKNVGIVFFLCRRWRIYHARTARRRFWLDIRWELSWQWDSSFTILNTSKETHVISVENKDVERMVEGYERLCSTRWIYGICRRKLYVILLRRWLPWIYEWGLKNCRVLKRDLAFFMLCFTI